MQYNTIDVSDRIYVNKTSASKECELCHYQFFKDIGFRFEEHVCNKCHDLLTIADSLKDSILNAEGPTFRCILMGISKNEAIKRLNNSVTHDRNCIVLCSIVNLNIQFRLKYLPFLISHFSQDL